MLTYFLLLLLFFLFFLQESQNCNFAIFHVICFEEPGNCQSFQNSINVIVKLTYGHFHSLQDVERKKVTTIE